MLLPTMTIDVKDNRTISSGTKRLAAPLLSVAALLAGEARARIIGKHTLASGQLMPRYSRFAKYLREVEAGGARRTRKPGKERWDLSRRGEMWRSLKVRLQSPVKASAGFYGGDRGITPNESKIRGMMKRENIDRAAAMARLKNMGALNRTIKNADLARIHNSKLPGDANHILANTQATLRDAERLVLAGMAPSVFNILRVKAGAEGRRVDRAAAKAEIEAAKHQRKLGR